MEDGVKEDPAQHKEPKFLGKAGWVKKAPGRLLASYKDRYIRVEKTEIVVYENEDLENCLERVDLENYDKCHELKSPFKKKHRLVLIRSAKSGNKVHDVKFQAPNPEEKEAWIKALSDGICRAKNKIFDEVKIDESSNLEHVTRSRPKGNRNRRPPTRIHMKEVAGVSSEGILRLDLDLEAAVMPNGATDGTQTLKEDATVPKAQSSTSEPAEKKLELIAEEKAETEPEISTQKKVIKPPMPPNKGAKSSPPPEEPPDNVDVPEKKVLKPPMPPSKEVKPSLSPAEETTEKAEPETASEMSPNAKKKTGPPPTPPSKPSSGSTAEASQSKPNPHPPAPPSKEKKPTHPDQQVQDTANENTKKEDKNRKESKGIAWETAEADQSLSREALPGVRDEGSESPSTEGEASKDKSGETVSSEIKTFDSEPHISTEPLRKSPSPLTDFKEKPESIVEPDTQHIETCSAISQPSKEPDSAASDSSAGSLETEEALPKSEVCSLNEPLTDSLNSSPLLCHLSGEKKKKAEEKSVDSGQHSDDESSGSEDTLATSTAALRGSHAGLDVLDTSEDIQTSVNTRMPQAVTKLQVSPKIAPSLQSLPIVPLKPSAKVRSASIGDLLSESPAKPPGKPRPRSARPPSDVTTKLETEVALEIEKTSELQSRVSQARGECEGGDTTEDLLAKAMEKLKKADHVLREVKKLKLANNPSKRKSW